MDNAKLKWLFFVTKPYSFSILEPIQQAITESDYGIVKWFSASSATNYSCPGDQLKSNEEVSDYSPDAVIVPAGLCQTPPGQGALWNGALSRGTSRSNPLQGTCLTEESSTFH